MEQGGGWFQATAAKAAAAAAKVAADAAAAGAGHVKVMSANAQNISKVVSENVGKSMTASGDERFDFIFGEGSLGLDLKADVVHEAVPGGQAWRHGIHAEDRLVSVAGESLSSILADSGSDISTQEAIERKVMSYPRPIVLSFVRQTASSVTDIGSTDQTERPVPFPTMEPDNEACITVLQAELAAARQTARRFEDEMKEATEAAANAHEDNDQLRVDLELSRVWSDQEAVKAEKELSIARSEADWLRAEIDRLGAETAAASAAEQLLTAELRAEARQVPELRAALLRLTASSLTAEGASATENGLSHTAGAVSDSASLSGAAVIEFSEIRAEVERLRAVLAHAEQAATASEAHSAASSREVDRLQAQCSSAHAATEAAVAAAVAIEKQCLQVELDQLEQARAESLEDRLRDQDALTSVGDAGPSLRTELDALRASSAEEIHQDRLAVATFGQERAECHRESKRLQSMSSEDSTRNEISIKEAAQKNSMVCDKLERLQAANAKTARHTESELVAFRDRSSLLLVELARSRAEGLEESEGSAAAVAAAEEQVREHSAVARAAVEAESEARCRAEVTAIELAEVTASCRAEFHQSLADAKKAEEVLAEERRRGKDSALEAQSSLAKLTRSRSEEEELSKRSEQVERELSASKTLVASLRSELTRVLRQQSDEIASTPLPPAGTTAPAADAMAGCSSATVPKMLEVPLLAGPCSDLAVGASEKSLRPQTTPASAPQSCDVSPAPAVMGAEIMATQHTDNLECGFTSVTGEVGESSVSMFLRNITDEILKLTTSGDLLDGLVELARRIALLEEDNHSLQRQLDGRPIVYQFVAPLDDTFIAHENDVAEATSPTPGATLTLAALYLVLRRRASRGCLCLRQQRAALIIEGAMRDFTQLLLHRPLLLWFFYAQLAMIWMVELWRQAVGRPMTNDPLNRLSGCMEAFAAVSVTTAAAVPLLAGGGTLPR